MRVAALGRTRWLYDSIRAIVRGGHEIVLIGTCPPAPEYVIRESAFRALADELGCPSFCDSGIDKHIDMVRESDAQVAISVNWLTLIGQQVIDQFDYGIINVHTGDLPRFRGNATPNWAILTGEEKIVLTMHKMTAELDAGPILSQIEFPLDADKYIGDIHRWLSKRIPDMFVATLRHLDDLSEWEREQDSDRTSLRCFPRLPRDSEIDWDLPAIELARLVRASSEPFSGAYSFIGTEKMTVWRARAGGLPFQYLGTPGQVAEIRRDTGEVVVLAGNKSVLILEEVETVSGGRGVASSIIGSIRVRLGMDVTQEIARLSKQICRSG